MPKPKFKKKVKRIEPKETVFHEKYFTEDAPLEDKFVQDVEILMADWSMTTTKDVTPKDYLIKHRGFSTAQARKIMLKAKTVVWHEKRKEYEQQWLSRTVKSQVEIVTEMNDQHIKGAKLGFAKAVEMLSKMKSETYVDTKTGKMHFSQFSASDLKKCVDTIQVAQKVMRTALGLPSDEGAVHIWQQLNINPADGSNADEREQEVRAAEKLFTYDDIRALIASQEAKDGEGVIDVTPKAVNPSELN